MKLNIIETTTQFIFSIIKLNPKLHILLAKKQSFYISDVSMLG
jgi:hypothetical protein